MLRDVLIEEVQKTIKNLYPNIACPEILIARSPRLELGDYSAIAAFGLSSKIGRNPLVIAEEIKEELLKSENFNRYVSSIEVAGGGFLNLWISEEGLREGLEKFYESRSRKLPLRDRDSKYRKIQVDFISANPTGELHIGHGRSAFYGDALSNILETANCKVEREYFINDAKASAQIRELGKTALGKGETYLTKNLKSLLQRRIRLGRKISNFKNKLKKLENDSEAGYLLAREIQKDNEKFIKRLGIKFNNWFSEEKELFAKSRIKKTLELLRRRRLVYKKDGAVWLKTSKYGDNEDRVIVRSDGTPTYFLSDIAYHINKFQRGFKKIIDIWGADHQGHVKSMLAAKKALGWEGDLDILIAQMVAIKQAGAKKKLSKRKGEVILLEDLLKEVGLDVLRWFFLEKALSTQMEFDMKLAKERSKKNPVYYVQYAHARACSILRKAGIIKGKTDFSSIGLGVGTLMHFKMKAQEEKSAFPERNLILKLIQFPEIVEDIAKDYQVHRLTIYACELAKVFTDFYENIPVLQAETEELKNFRFALVFIARKILEKTLSLMGISAPQRM
jgi:arginyl-tRNA synthetase